MALPSAYHQLPLFPTEKAISACSRLLPLAQYYKKRGTSDGLTSACKECCKARERAYHKEHGDKRKTARAAWYQANREQVKEQRRAYYERNKDACQERGRQSSRRRQERRNGERTAREAARPKDSKVCSRCCRRLPLEAFYRKKEGRLGVSARCKECVRAHVRGYYGQNRAACNARHAAYYAANRERLQAAARAYDHAHREHRTAAGRAWRVANAERARASQRAWYQANRERLRARGRAYEDANRAEVRERRLRWQRANAEKMRQANRRSHLENKHNGKHRARGMRRRALQYAAEGYFAATDVQQLYAAQEGLCAYCGSSVGETFELDHKTPLSRGGSNWIDNLALTCAPCNRSKHAKTAEEFRALRAQRSQ